MSAVTRSFSIDSDLASAAERKCAEEYRTMSNYISMLIAKDVKPWLLRKQQLSDEVEALLVEQVRRSMLRAEASNGLPQSGEAVDQ